MRGFEGLEARLDALGHALMEWWAWPCALVVLAALTLALSWLYTPGPGEQVTVFGRAASAPCPMLVQTGTPCGQCGMTRSWVWAARGHWLTALRYHPAGFLAWLGLVSGGLVGVTRLLRRDPAFGQLSWRAVAAFAGGWVLLYAVCYQLRLLGYNALPP